MRTKQAYVMGSNGGIASFGRAGRHSVETILSGPAAGVIAGERWLEAAANRNVITFDMGGTSTDVALIENGQPIRRVGGVVHRQNVLIPMIDIHTVAAGGGTKASVRLGNLEVGPASAGAVPGPAAYGRGGVDPTVTDADVVLGYIPASQPLGGGALSISRDLARDAVRTRVAEALGVAVETAAQGIVDVVNAKMQEAIKVVSANRGYDLRDFYLLAFGGAGPLHAVAVAQDLGMRGVVIPPFPGVTSAIGLVSSDIRHDYVGSLLTDFATVDLDELNHRLERLSEEGSAQVRAEGFRQGDWRYEYAVDLRYAGQGYELTIPVDHVPLGREDLLQTRRRFDSTHEQLTGHCALDSAVELVSYRASVVVPAPRRPLRFPFAGAGDLSDALVGTERAWFDGSWVATPLYDRSKLPPGAELLGPAIVVQADATSVIPPEVRALVDASCGHIRVEF